MPAPPPPAPAPAPGPGRGARRLAWAAVLAFMAAGAAAAQAPGSAEAPGTAPPPAATGAGAAAPGDSPADRDQAGAAPLLHHREELLVEGVAELVPATTSIVKLPLPTRLLPASIDVIGAPLLEQQDAHVLGDALRD